MNLRRTFIKQIGIGTAGLAIGPSLFSFINNIPSAPHNLPRSTPELQGVSSVVLNYLFDAMNASTTEFHSVMVLRNGYVIGEGWWSPYAPQYKHTLHSLSKSFTSAAVGLAINEGHFTVDTPVISFFPEYLPQEVSPNLAAIKVKHLLTMTTGHDVDKGLRTDAEPWVKSFLAAPITYQPGTFYLYNTTASYMLSAIVQKTTGQKVIDFLRPRLFKPLKIEGADWEVSPQGINTGGFGLRVRTEDIASFTQLYLNKGVWNGRQIIPQYWVEESSKTQWNFKSNPFGGTKPKEHDDWQQGYGYQFWRTQHNGFRSDGLYGQFGIVLPDEKTVIAITEQSFDTQSTLDFLWNILLPGLQKGILPENIEGRQKLITNLNSLAVKDLQAKIMAGTNNQIHSKKYVLDANSLGAKEIILNFGYDTCEFVAKYEAGDRRLVFGMNKWEIAKNGNLLNSQLPFPVAELPNVSSPVAAAATWIDSNTITFNIRPVETVTSDSITCVLNDNTIKMSFLQSVARHNPGKGIESRPELIGHLI